MSWIAPVGLDFADGATLLPVQPAGSSGTPMIVGTPLPTAFIDFWGNLDGLEEPPGSPRIERAEQCTCEHRVEFANYSDALAYWAQMSRGTIVNDSAANIWCFLSADVTRLEANTGELHYVMESLSFDSPPDDFSINDVSLDLNIIKHPRYAWALNPYVTDASTYTQVGDTPVFYTDIKEAIIRMIQNYTDSPFYPSQAQVQGLIQTNILSMLNISSSNNAYKIQVHYPNKNYNGSQATVPPVAWDGTNANLPNQNCVFFLLAVPFSPSDPTNPINIALAAARELISKLWRQEDTPYIAGYEVTWTQYFFAPVYLNPGGYIEDPRAIVPSYFMSPESGTVIPRGKQDDPFGGDTVAPAGVNGVTIFDQLTYINPQCYAVNGIRGGALSMSCLRKSDRVEYERTWFKYPHTWLCAPVGKWDSDLYTQANRPQLATDYNQYPTTFGE